MARTNRQKRLRMEVLEVRRVLTTAPTAIDIFDSSELIGPEPFVEITGGAPSNLTNLFIDTTTASPLEPGVAQWSAVGNTSTLSFYPAPTQLIVPDTPLVSLASLPIGNVETYRVADFTGLLLSNGNGINSLDNSDAVTIEDGNSSSFFVAGGNGTTLLANGNVSGNLIGNAGSTTNVTISSATITVGLQQTLDIQPTLLLANADGALARISPSGSLRPIIELYEFDADHLRSADFGQTPSMGLGGQPADTESGWSAFVASPRSGLVGGSSFDVPPSRISLDVIELPGPELSAEATGTDGTGKTSNPTAVDGNDPGLGAPDAADPAQAAASLTVDIGPNHPVTDNHGLAGLDVAVTTSLEAHRDSPGDRQLVVSDIDMARQHRLQLAATIPTPIGEPPVDDGYSRIVPAPQPQTELATTDLLFVVGREMASENWFDHWITEAHLTEDELSSPSKQVSDEESDGKQAGLPVSERSELLIDAHSKSEQTTRSRWQWAVDALLASAGLGAMIFHDRYGRLAEEKSEFRLRR